MKTESKIVLSIFVILALIFTAVVVFIPKSTTTDSISASKTTLWKQSKLNFVFSLPDEWIASETDAGNASIIRIYSNKDSLSQSDAEIFVQLSQSYDLDQETEFKEWMNAHSENLGSKGIKFQSVEVVMVDNVQWIKKIDQTGRKYLYTQLKENNGFFRYSFDAKNVLTNELEAVFLSIQLNPADEELSKSKMIQ
ncbi:hypothetical protein HY771_02625 [Candidatus Uhrbacteria bacterium]|nr:hypothetical protein [Candidatus Uhrbacteria bacterium]